MSIIEVSDLTKQFVINKRQPGLSGIIKSMLKPERVSVQAVDKINFTVKKGEIVGFIGPNGAGKSTTIKILTGILMPSGGKARVYGREPYKNRMENAKSIGVVFGQRTQLWWNLPVIESFALLRTIYRIPGEQYNRNIELFTDILEINKFLYTPVRQLSLGQRMRVEIAASLLHNPAIIYLDEPTIGLDVIAKEKIREFIKEINAKNEITVILTTHDMGDIEKLCDRIIIIDNGKIIYDGSVKEIKDVYGKNRILIADFEDDSVTLELDAGDIIKEEGGRKHILFNRDQISIMELVRRLSEQARIRDFTLQETEIEDIVKYIYKNKVF